MMRKASNELVILKKILESKQEIILAIVYGAFTGISGTPQKPRPILRGRRHNTDRRKRMGTDAHFNGSGI